MSIIFLKKKLNFSNCLTNFDCGQSPRECRRDVPEEAGHVVRLDLLVVSVTVEVGERQPAEAPGPENVSHVLVKTLKLHYPVVVGPADVTCVGERVGQTGRRTKLTVRSLLYTRHLRLLRRMYSRNSVQEGVLKLRIFELNSGQREASLSRWLVSSTSPV